ncbi:unnamed protein product, partial [Ectocarpus sp. 12 AP-2014]
MGDADRASVDDEVVYSYDVHNNGTTTMSDIQIVDSMVPTTGSDAELSCNASLASISPGASINCQALIAFLVRQADIDSGESTSAVVVKAMPPAADAEPITSSSRSTVPLPQAPGVSITKTLSTHTVALGRDQTIVDAGDTMNFTMSVENVGNTWVSAIAVVDPFLEGIACSPDLSTSDSRFAVGAAAVVCTATVSVDQAMVDDGFMESESTVS